MVLKSETSQMLDQCFGTLPPAHHRVTIPIGKFKQIFRWFLNRFHCTVLDLTCTCMETVMCSTSDNFLQSSCTIHERFVLFNNLQFACNKLSSCLLTFFLVSICLLFDTWHMKSWHLIVKFKIQGLVHAGFQPTNAACLESLSCSLAACISTQNKRACSQFNDWLLIITA